MKRNGNVNANRTFNLQNTKPPIPLDVDEVDGVLERFIRQKYDQHLFSNGHTRPALSNNTGSTRSSEDQPPPLPPKPTKRFGFGLRSSSSTFYSSRNGLTSPPRSPQAPNGWSGPPSPIRVNKQSRVFGASVGGGGDDIETKLAQLRDMGFSDDKRNLNVLKGCAGNLDRTVESLARLGEGSASNSRSRTPIQPRTVVVSQPFPSPVRSASAVAVNGISFASNETVSQTNTGSTNQQSSRNLPQPQEPIAARSFSVGNPYHSQYQSYNPFDTSAQQSPNPSLDMAFGGLQIAQQQPPQKPIVPQPPLFPNATGGYPNQPPPMQDPRLQSMTPPVPQLPQQYAQSNPYAQTNQNPTFNYNPFFQTSQTSQQSTQPTPAPLNQYPPSHQFPSSYNPFQQASSNQSPFQSYPDSPQTYSPFTQQGTFQQQAFGHQPQLLQQQQQQTQQPDLFSPQHPMTDPVQYGLQNQQQQQQQQHQAAQHFPKYGSQALQPQQTGRIDKSSILALYNYPQLAPPPIPNNLNNPSNNTTAEPQNTSQGLGIAPTPQRSATMPIPLSSGSKNPFQTTAPGSTNASGLGFGRQTIQESVDLGSQNGRHSPDAFASLSARFVKQD